MACFPPAFLFLPLTSLPFLVQNPSARFCRFAGKKWSSPHARFPMRSSGFLPPPCLFFRRPWGLPSTPRVTVGWCNGRSLDNTTFFFYPPSPTVFFRNLSSVPSLCPFPQSTRTLLWPPAAPYRRVPLRRLNALPFSFCHALRWRSRVVTCGHGPFCIMAVFF